MKLKLKLWMLIFMVENSTVMTSEENLLAKKLEFWVSGLFLPSLMFVTMYSRVGS